ncbi:MAG: hypothetical protein FWG16_01910 [Micrococcales bacterium]|nr:hypothetical protein [Micrococcales bacterium]
MLIGIDIGGTHTRIAVACPPAATQRVDLLTTDWRRGQLFSDQANAQRLVSSIPLTAHQRGGAPLAAGVHGCDSDQQCQLLASWLGACHDGPVLVVNDSELFGPAMGLPQSINVVLGTGSIVLGRDQAGRMVKMGGYGWILGDPGSAPGLVRESVKAIAQAYDAGQSPGVLAQELMAHFGSPDPIELVYDFTADAEITRWGALCPLVFEAAEAGDLVALGVIEAAASQLAKHIHQVRQKGAMGSDVVLGGGVVRSQPRLGRQIGIELAKSPGDLSITTLKHEPVNGALALAASLTPGANQQHQPEIPGKADA